MTLPIACLMATLGVASAHTIMQAVGVGSTTYPQGEGIYMPSDDSFIGDVTSDSLACNGAPVTGFKSSSSVIEVKAGDTVTGSWLHTLSSTGADSTADNKVIDSSHKGPVLAYMKKVDDATQNPSAGPGDGWFKVAESGLISSTEWAVDALISAGGVQSVTIPTCIEDGDYLLRFEIIALHSAFTEGAAQFYMECAQLRVSGGSGASSPTTYAIPGIYSATDPGIKVMIYDNSGRPYPASYTIPGPEVFTCSGDSASASSGNSSAVSGQDVSPDSYASSAAPATSAPASTADSGYGEGSSTAVPTTSAAGGYEDSSSAEAAPTTPAAGGYEDSSSAEAAPTTPAAGGYGEASSAAESNTYAAGGNGEGPSTAGPTSYAASGYGGGPTAGPTSYAASGYGVGPTAVPTTFATSRSPPSPSGGGASYGGAGYGGHQHHQDSTCDVTYV